MISMVPLKEESMPAVDDVTAFLASNWEGLSVPTEAEDGDQSISFKLDGALVVVATMPAPIPWSQLEGPCATSILWPDAEEELKGHKAHLIVTVAGELEPLEIATILTQVTAAALSACSEAIGVYWGNATLVIPSPVFHDFAVEMLPESFPIPIWIDMRGGMNEKILTSGFTAGMEALGHMEFETNNASDSVGGLRERLFGLAAYVLENGPVIQDGNTVGEDRNERINVVYSGSEFGHEGKVMRLDYQQTGSAKPWWKSW
jgi:hypothetical protein